MELGVARFYKIGGKIMGKVWFKTIIMAFFLSTILITGCISNDETNQKTRDGESEDLDLSISMNNRVFSKESNIIINVKLENIAEESIKVNEIFTIASNIKIIITPPDNTIKEIFPEHGDFIEQEKLTLKPNDFMETSFDLNDPNLQYYYKNGSINKIEDFNLLDCNRGLYKIKVKYVSVNPEIYSNVIEFEII